MNYFWVFQNRTYHEERDGGFLWAPKSNNGRTFSHWTLMTEVKEGDMIFSSYHQQLTAVIKATSDCRSSSKPASLEANNEWEQDGWIVQADYSELRVPVSVYEYMDEILRLQGEKYAPFNVSGRGNTGYLFRVTSQLAQFLLELLEQSGNRLRDSLPLQSNLSLEVLIEQIETELPYTLSETEKEQIVKSRIGQDVFRRKLETQGISCKICGVSNRDLLLASHIKPWKDCDNTERIDAFNGFLMCPAHDSLFDKGYISFTDFGEILISANLDALSQTLLNVNPYVRIQLHERNMPYLGFHRDKIFRS